MYIGQWSQTQLKMGQGATWNASNKILQSTKYWLQQMAK